VGLALGLGLGIPFIDIRPEAPSKVDHIFRKGQLLSAAFYSRATALTTRKRQWE